MTEPHPGAELDQPRRLGRRRRVGADPEPLGRAPQQGRRRRPARPPRRAAVVASRPEATRAAAGSSARSGSPAAARRAARTRPPAPPASTRAAAPAARAGCRASRRRSGPAPARPAGPGITESSSARASPSLSPPTTSSGSPASSCPRSARAPRTPSATDSASSRRATNASDLRRGPVEPLRVVDHADERLLLGHLGQQARAPPDRPGSDPAPLRHSGRTPCRAHRAAGPADRSSRSSIGAQSWCSAGERELHLGLDARRSRDAAARPRSPTR